MQNEFYYIVITSCGTARYVSRDVGETEDFDRAMHFASREAAEDYLLRLPDGNGARVLPCVMQPRQRRMTVIQENRPCGLFPFCTVTRRKAKYRPCRRKGAIEKQGLTFWKPLLNTANNHYIIVDRIDICRGGKRSCAKDSVRSRFSRQNRQKQANNHKRGLTKCEPLP